MINCSVLHIAPISSLNAASGLFYAVPGIASACIEVGFDIALVTTSRRGMFISEQDYATFHYKNLPRGICSLPGRFRRPDLMVLHSTYVPAHISFARQAKAFGIPVVLVPHGGMTQGAQSLNRWKKRLGNLLFFSRMVRDAAAIHCLSETEAIDVRAWGRPVFVVGNGVDLPSEGHMAKPGGQAGLRLLFLGRLDPNHKGLDLLLEGCGLAEATLRRADACVIIHGPSIDGSAEKLRAMVRSFELDELVHVEGPVFNEDKVRAFASADIFVHTSRFEGHPIAVLEALSYGLPCLLTPGTNMADEVVAAGAGWRAAGTPQGIAQTLIDAVESRERLSDMGRRARALAATRYTWAHVGQQLAQHYREIIRASK